MQEFDEGEKACIDTEPAVQEGMPHPRFHGRTVEVVEDNGSSYVVELKDGGKRKQFTINPAHLSEDE